MSEWPYKKNVCCIIFVFVSPGHTLNTFLFLLLLVYYLTLRASHHLCLAVCLPPPGPLPSPPQVVSSMYGICFKAGSTVLQQGALPEPEDCTYFLEEGVAEVVISGAGDQTTSVEDR